MNLDALEDSSGGELLCPYCKEYQLYLDRFSLNATWPQHPDYKKEVGVIVCELCNAYIPTVRQHYVTQGGKKEVTYIVKKPYYGR